ncbi:hypothetical protein QR680_007571 [Steinernema hermaphroditum]|uniref:Uncharacterized protein n=1 Tax=Steinernema hermaphroditum TaxID=289476 RepID=A0AA39M6L5_9BILA|nr:hypothetical protein QR680_007571 [Steinernema hermaphroditum]
MAPRRQLASGALRQVSRKRLAQVIAVQTTKPRGRGRPRKEAAVVNPEPVNHVEIEPNAADLAVNREVGVVSEEASVAPAHQQEATVRAGSTLLPAHVTLPTATLAALISNLMGLLNTSQRTEGDVLGEYVTLRFTFGMDKERFSWRKKLLRLAGSYL